MESITRIWQNILRLFQWLSAALPGAARDTGLEGIRWSYVILLALVACGLIMNLFLPHGWTVWPIIGVAGILLFVHEAADRNGSGIPLLYVYALAGVALLTWVAIVMALSVVNPFILWLGILGLAGYCARDWLKQHQHQNLILQRRENGLCIHCGEPATADDGICPNCGQDPDPDGSQAQRIRAVMNNSGGGSGGGRAGNHARSVLKGETLAQNASRKESALIANRSRPGGGARGGSGRKK